MTSLRAAVVQAASVIFDREATLDRVDKLAAQAVEMGAQLIVFPEAFVSGYPRGLDFGTRIGSRSEAGRQWFARYWESSVDVPGPACDRLGATARRARAYLIVGVIEREGGTLYCTVLYFAPDGRLAGKHRKLMPTGAERLAWGFGDGSTMGLLDTPWGKLGTAICWENYMPLYRTWLYGQGVQLYCAPTADPRDTWQATVRHIAVEGRCFVLSCNQSVAADDYPDDYPADDPSLLACRGGSCIVDPLGEVLAGPLFDTSGILTADLDMQRIACGKYDLDVVGHYARPDIFRLLVDTRPQRPVAPIVAADETSGPH